MAETVTVEDLLVDHPLLDVECQDRMCRNGYVPKLQLACQVVGL